MKSLISRLALGCVAILLIASAASSQTSSIWNGGTGAWKTARDWTPSGVPNNGGGSTYNVSIYTGSDTVTLNTSPTINLLDLGGATGVINTSVLEDSSGSPEILTINGALAVGLTGELYLDDHGSTVSAASVTNAGTILLQNGSSLSVSGNLINSSFIGADYRCCATGSSLIVTGAFTNNDGASFYVGGDNQGADVASVGTLVNNGLLQIGMNATLNLTNQPNGITDVGVGSTINLSGTLKAGSNNGLAKLASIEGTLLLENGQALTLTPTTLTVGNVAFLYITFGSSLTATNLTNSGTVATDYNCCTTGGSLTVTGTFTNNSGASLYVGGNNQSTDVANIGTLVNNGITYIGAGATLNLTNQANGIADVAGGSSLDLHGTLKAGSNNGLYKLASIEGTLELENGQTTTDTAATLTVSNTGFLDIQGTAGSPNVGSSFAVANITNSGNVSTDYYCCGGNSALTVTGTFTNNAGADLEVGENNIGGDVANIGTLLNNGSVYVGTGSTLNLTNQVNGITDVAAGSLISNSGTINAGANNAFYKLASIEGTLELENGTSTADTAATLTIAGGGFLDIQSGSSFSVASITNSGSVGTDNLCCGTGSSFTVSGTFTNNSGATFDVGTNNEPANDMDSVGTLTNTGTVNIGWGSTLTLTKVGGTSTNNGTINVGNGSGPGTLDISGNTTLTGTTGKVVLSGFAGNIIGGTGILTNGANTIEGEGNIGNGQIGLINTGSILANQTKSGTTPSTLYIDTSSAGFSNSSGTKNGTLNVSAKNTIDIEGGPFTNYSSGTLTGGTYLVAGTLEFNAGGVGIVTNDAAITLSSATAEIRDTSNNSNMLTVFADNGTKGTFTVNGFTFTDANDFTNSGILVVSGGGVFSASTALTNFNSTNGTLTGGTYNLTGTGQLKFNNGGFSNDIVTNDAHITLSGVDTTKSPIIDQTGANALANFAANGSSGNLTLSADRNFTTPGNFSNAGTVDVAISTGTGKTELTIGGPGVYTQTGGSTIVDGVLSASGGINIQGGFLYGDALTTTGNEGTLVGPVNFTVGTLSPGNAAKILGTLDITGNYAESGTAVLDVDLDGTVAGSKYDVLNVSGAAALGGTIDFVLNSAFKPVVGDTWDVLNYASATGSFANVELPTAPTGDQYVFACGATDCTLTLEAGGATVASSGVVSGTPAKAVSRGSLKGATTSTHEPTAILSRATCFAASMIGSACGDKPSAATVAHGGDIHDVTSAHTELNSAHNNVIVATRSISSGRGGASQESSASASAMARLYVCAYLPSTLGHAMGCS
jgi:fibronectin-binding autotransporter adhesin